MSAPIVLEKILQVGERYKKNNFLDIRFLVNPQIPNETVRQFYLDVTKIIRRLDSDCNFEDELSIFGTKSWGDKDSYRYVKCHWTRQSRSGDPYFFANNAIRENHIWYRRGDVIILPDWEKLMQDNERPSLSINAFHFAYDVDELVKSIVSLPYIGVSVDYSEKCHRILENKNEPEEAEEVKKQFFSRTGSIFTIVK